MKLPCLVDWNVCLIVCEIDEYGDKPSITARWSHVKDDQLAEILGKEIQLREPKKTNSKIYTIRIPKTQNGQPITAVHTDVQFPLISVADNA